MRQELWWVAFLALSALACGENGEDNGTGGSAGAKNVPGKAGSPAGSGGTKAGGSPAPAGKSSAADVARRMGRKPNFLIGMGNDLPSDYVWERSGIYTLPVPLDLHYVYLTYGWENWNPGGAFPAIIAGVDAQKGATPMADVYALTGQGENNFEVLTNDQYMGPYWAAAQLLMERYAETDKPAVVHLEPDFWGFAQQKSGSNPTSVPAHLHADCAELPKNISGLGRCWVKLARSYAPKVLVGFHASQWAAGSGKEIGDFLTAAGAAEADLVIIDMLDRDAGCFEAATLPQCMRGGSFYWDESNRTSPNFHEHLAWAKEVSEAVGKPILWWQLPFGVPSNAPGGSPGHYRDNRVKYLFEHVEEFVDAGGLGACFGTGAGDQTYITTDGGQFEAAVDSYYKSPVPLP